MQLVDLHVHSNFSDGACSPTEVVRLAKEAGLSAVALTDHNTIDGLDDFLSQCEKLNIEAVAGVEISSEYNGVELHVVALCLDNSVYSKVRDFLAIQAKRKEENNELLARRLCKSGYKVDYEKIKKEAQGTINRVHFAKELIKNGYISSVSEGFSTILSEKDGLYVPPKRLSTFEVIEFIKSINCVSVLAHPLLSFDSKDQFLEFLPKAKELGLDAIEVRYSKYSLEDQEFCTEVAKRFNLLMSGGSDFHGQNKPDISIGKGVGNLQVPYEFLQKIKERKGK